MLLLMLCGFGTAAKSAKKNKKRAAKRRDEGGSQWDASSINGSTGLPPLEEVASQASFGGETSGAAGDAGSVASAGRYITCKCATRCRHDGWKEADAVDSKNDCQTGQQQQQQCLVWVQGEGEGHNAWYNSS